MVNFLNKNQRDELLEELKLERSRKYADRIRVILLLDAGKSYKSIAEYLFLDESSIANYRKRYKEGGLDCLVNDFYSGRKALLTSIETKILTEHLQKNIYSSTKAIINYVKKKFGINYSRGGMTNLLHRLGFSFKKSTPVPGKARKKEQEKFVKKYNNIKNENTIYFADSTHPEFAPHVTYGWIKVGKKFEVKTNSGWRKRVNVIGAIDINNLDIITRTWKTINKFSVCDLLKSIKRKNPKKKSLILILDGAAYNRSKEVKRTAKELKIKILYLPPYSPNLNPIERLWKFMKNKVMANKYYEEFDTFKKSVVTFFRGIRKHQNELKSLITDNFPILGT